MSRPASIRVRVLWAFALLGLAAAVTAGLDSGGHPTGGDHDEPSRGAAGMRAAARPPRAASGEGKSSTRGGTTAAATSGTRFERVDRPSWIPPDRGRDREARLAAMRAALDEARARGDARSVMLFESFVARLEAAEPEASDEGGRRPAPRTP